MKLDDEPVTDVPDVDTVPAPIVAGVSGKDAPAMG